MGTGGAQGGYPPLGKRFYDPPFEKSQDLLSKTTPMGPLTPLASMTVPTYGRDLSLRIAK